MVVLVLLALGLAWTVASVLMIPSSESRSLSSPSRSAQSNGRGTLSLTSYPLSALPTTTTVPAPVPEPSPVTATERAEWTRVAICEEGSWVGSSGAAYPDSLGISAVNWRENGGTSDVSEDAQIRVAERIQRDPPDQQSCAAW